MEATRQSMSLMLAMCSFSRTARTLKCTNDAPGSVVSTVPPPETVDKD
jgi:hypothetical protein